MIIVVIFGGAIITFLCYLLYTFLSSFVPWFVFFLILFVVAVIIAIILNRLKIPKKFDFYQECKKQGLSADSVNKDAVDEIAQRYSISDGYSHYVKMQNNSIWKMKFTVILYGLLCSIGAIGGGLGISLFVKSMNYNLPGYIIILGAAAGALLFSILAYFIDMFLD